MPEYIERGTGVSIFRAKANMAVLMDAAPYFEKAAQMLEQLPTVDAVVVTRCKECEHAERYERIDGTVGYYCGHPQNTFTYGERWDRVFKPVKEPDGFCNRGEPKEG